MPEFHNETYTIDMIISKILTDDKQYDIGKLIAAYEYAAQCHQGQTRSSGQPYIIHPVTVAYILLELGMDTDTLCAALLHDVVEDTSATLDTVRKRFGHDVAMLVDGVTKLTKIPTFSKEQQQAENMMKILMAMSQDIRVMIIKLADRLHNMRTLQYRPPHKRSATSNETLSVYAPIAHRLGISSIQEELEDLSFYYLDPFAYEEIEKLLEHKKEEREALVESIKARISERFKAEDFKRPPQIEGRVKSIYGIYKKLYLKHKTIDEIYDKYAVRVIVSDSQECYSVLGMIHDMFSPIPNRFKDYIANKKSNGYQSLHTSVLGKEGIPFEVQIRTWDMHANAEYGIAAHWKYKENVQGRTAMDSRIVWIRQVLETQQNSDDPEELVSTIKNDIAPEDIVVITPKGKSIALPVGSTAIDFAYHIHTEIGHRMTGVKIGGKIVPITQTLKTGDVCEIITSKDPQKGPNRSWIEIVKTNEARSKIRAWFKRECRPENIATGKSKLQHEFRRLHLNVSAEQLETIVKEDLHQPNCTTLNDLYAVVGYDGIPMTKILPRIREAYMRRFGNTEQLNNDEIISVQKPRKPTSGIIVDGLDQVEVKLASCCSPLRGEEIIGFTTIGHGITIHRQKCKKYQKALHSGNPDDMKRWISAKWADSAGAEEMNANIEVLCVNNISILSQLTAVINEAHLPVSNFNFHSVKSGDALLQASVRVSSLEQLENLLNRLRSIHDVISADRAIYKI
ncbi:MAG: bifunctional (p)ppGpp synthetase/guanosine-3',5'-bis(diphosphate) 3'-pyrophosphohydrolase [Oscillospiraceae bacterium]|nr:bifunctional (p)ppGpp synthetase/guanosine-3',5'-bis(diphosphate) 3'-pyrophosphohydrolase [Oscillospiraceae bacterium]